MVRSRVVAIGLSMSFVALALVIAGMTTKTQEAHPAIRGVAVSDERHLKS